ncbi:MAG: TonB-dependent receptor [Bacteroides sp.]
MKTHRFFTWCNRRTLDKHLSMLLVVCLMAMIPVTTFAQLIKITMKKTNTTLQTVVRELEKQSGYSFFYNDNKVKLNKKISINVNEVAFEEVLKEVFKDSGYSYKIVDNQIVISSISPSHTPSTTQQKTARSIKGVVTDANGEPIIGASVIEKSRTTNGTITNINGQFSLDVYGNELEISYIGYGSQTIALKKDNSFYNVVLKEDTKTLDEVIVVGYSTQRKESLTGAMQAIKGDKLKDVTTPSVENMLSGKIPGVYVAPGSGRPGASGAVVIRGRASLTGTTSPLWVVDGVIVGTDGTGQINPQDIESMTVLKDAASTAIYGSQGANGVIIITTKNPKAEKMSVNVSAKLGVTQLNTGNLEMMNGKELYDYYSSFSNVDQIKFTRWNEDLQKSNFNWWDLATQDGFNQEYNVSLQGGSENLRAYMSVGVYDETGAVKGYDYTRYNFLFKTVYKPKSWLTIKPMLQGSRRDIDDKQYSVGAMYSMLPWDSPYDEEGNLVPHRYEGWVNGASTNYLYDLQYNHSGSTNYEFRGSLDFDVKLNDWLTFSSVNNYKYTNYASNSYSDPRSSGGAHIGDYRFETVRRYTNHILRFNKSFGKHFINGLAAYEYNDYWHKTLDVSGKEFIPGLEVLDIVTTPEKTKGNIGEWAVQSLLFNANYSYDNKYLAQVSFRRDGASNFGDSSKYGNFFSVSGGWNINREEWFDLDKVDQLKLRAAYGSVGNRPDQYYPQYNLYSVSASYNEEPGILIKQIGRNQLTWEKTYTMGLGLDASLFENRLRFNFDYYLKNTDNILYKVPISGLTGVTYIWKNIGKMKNQGIEIALGGDIIRTKDLTWSIDANVGHNTNELKQLFKSKDSEGNLVVKPILASDNSGIAGAAQTVLEPGNPTDTYYLKKWAGVDPETGSPLWYKTKKNEDGTQTVTTTKKYAEATYEKCGKASPDLFGGFNTTLTWRKLEVNAAFGYSIGGQIYNYSRQEYDSDGTYCDRNQMKLKDDWVRWEKPGDIATHPVASYNNQSKSNSASSRYLENSDYLKLRSLSIGYRFDLTKYSIKELRVFVSGENLFTLTGYSGVDPEIPISDEGKIIGTAGPSVYPSTRKFMLGLNLTF